MAIQYKTLIDRIEKIAPPDLAESWDNCGVQINTGADIINRVSVALEISMAVIDEAAGVNADLIVVHHPLIFQKINKIDCGDITGKYIYELIKREISVYAAHTTFDSVSGGNSDCLAGLLELREINKIQPMDQSSEPLACGRTGVFETEKRLKDVSRILKEKLRIGYDLPVVGDPDSLIKKVGVCTGGGGNMIKDIYRNECSLFITSDVRHHEAMFAKESGICLIDAGHYNTEIIFVANFAEKLRSAVGDSVDIYESKADFSPFLHI